MLDFNFQNDFSPYWSMDIYPDNQIESCEYSHGRVTLTGYFNIHKKLQASGYGRLSFIDSRMKYLQYYNFNEDGTLSIFEPLGHPSKKKAMAKELDCYQAPYYLPHKFTTPRTCALRAALERNVYFTERFAGKEKYPVMLTSPMFLFHNQHWLQVPYEYYPYFKIAKIIAFVSGILFTTESQELICITDWTYEFEPLESIPK